MCCIGFFAKYILFFFNLVISLAAIAFIALGVSVLVGITDLVDLIPVNLNTIPIFVIIIGSVIFLISFSGCCGAIRESRCLLVLYAVFMLILAAVKIALVVIISRQLVDLENTVTGWIDQAFANHATDGPFQVMEAAFKCCGTRGSESYNTIGIVPPTCCSNPENNICPAGSDFYGGCIDTVSGFFETYGEATKIVIIIVIVVEMVAMLFALYMNHTITKKNRSKNVY